MPLYRAYGLNIDSALDLPELLPAGPHSVCDATVEIATGLQDALEGGTQLGPFLWASPDALILRVPGVARFRVDHGSRVRVEPDAGIDPDSVRVFLLGSIFGAMLLQRGRLVLHGNAIQIGSGCVVCVGDSGIGKSTLAAGFSHRGYNILSDDVVAIDEDFSVEPGFPRIKLWQDTLGLLALDSEKLRRIRPSINKFDLPLGTKFATDSVAVRWVYVLEEAQADELIIEPLHGMAAVMQLRTHTYRARYLDGMGNKPAHLAQCAALANRASVARIARPRRGFTLDPIIDRILSDVGEIG